MSLLEHRAVIRDHELAEIWDGQLLDAEVVLVDVVLVQSCLYKQNAHRERDHGIVALCDVRLHRQIKHLLV